jgi:transposase
LLVDGRGVPLSLVVTGANRHDVTQLAAVLDGIVIKRVTPPKRRHKHLCVDAGYTGASTLEIMKKHGYSPHVKGVRTRSQGTQAQALAQDQTMDC